MHGLTRENDEVYYAPDRFPAVGYGAVEFLKSRALSNPRRRCRLCTHPSAEDRLHEMLIVQHRDAYFRPMRHLERSQSFHAIEGATSLALLAEDGTLERVFEVGAGGDTESPFYLRLPPRVWYAFVLRSEWFVFYEVTTGPLERGERELAPWAPGDDDPDAARAYSAEIRRRTDEWKG